MGAFDVAVVYVLLATQSDLFRLASQLLPVPFVSLVLISSSMLMSDSPYSTPFCRKSEGGVWIRHHTYRGLSVGRLYVHELNQHPLSDHANQVLTVSTTGRDMQ